MANSILASINSAFQPKLGQTNPLENIDLNDNTFSNIFDDKMKSNEENSESNTDNIMSKLGLPIGLNVEGFEYNTTSQIAESTDSVDAINTESNIRDDKKFDVKSLINDAKEYLEPIANNVLDAASNYSSAGVAKRAVRAFLQNQASSFYNNMNKDSVNDIGDLLAKL